MGYKTFDEWFEERNNGKSFEEMYCTPSNLVSDSMKELSRQMRNYVSEMVKVVGCEYS